MRKAGYSSAIHEIVDRLFVYGTLRAGQPARSLLEPHLARTVPATAAGDLIAFPDYPALVDRGAGTVVGELVWLTDLAAALPLLDAYEGDDYVRILKPIQTADGEEWAWCYVLADVTLAAAGTPVPHGDWVRWRGAVSS